MLPRYNTKPSSLTEKHKKELKRAIFKAKRMLPEYVFDTSQLEGNPITFPEVQTLIDGITIGGHKISDVQQVLNIKDSWELLFARIKAGSFTANKETMCSINGLIARDEALEWGIFRTGKVGIAGTTTYQAPAADQLDMIFQTELPEILKMTDPVEQALYFFLWAAYNQFFWDGNKRTARLMANGILISAGYGIFNIRSRDILAFNTLMVNFYNTGDADEVMKFLADHAVDYIE